VIVLESCLFAETDDGVDLGSLDDADVRFLVDDREGSAPANRHSWRYRLEAAAASS
jgi:hypothetical protein